MVSLPFKCFLLLAFLSNCFFVSFNCFYRSIFFFLQVFSIAFFVFFHCLFVRQFSSPIARFPFTRFPFACSPFQLLSVSFHCLDSVLFPSFFTRSFSPLIAYIPFDCLFSFHVIPTTSSNASFSLF